MGNTEKLPSIALQPCDVELLSKRFEQACAIVAADAGAATLPLVTRTRLAKIMIVLAKMRKLASPEIHALAAALIRSEKTLETTKHEDHAAQGALPRTQGLLSARNSMSRKSEPSVRATSGDPSVR